MKNILLPILFCIFFTELSAQYIASTATQASTAPVNQGARKEMILRVEVEIGATPVTLTKMQFNTIGSTNPITDIVNARLWFYNDSTALDTSLGLLIGTYTPPHGTNWQMLSASSQYVGPPSFSGMIPSQKNYFWLTYDINPNAILCDTIDGTIVEMFADGIPYAPTITSPAGYRVISPCITGLEDPLIENTVSVFPNPAQDDIRITYSSNKQENLTIELYNVTGSKVVTLFDGNIQTAFSEITFSLSNFPSGVYYLNCVSDKRVFVKKIMKL